MIASDLIALAGLAQHLPDAAPCIRWGTDYASGQIEIEDGTIHLVVEQHDDTIASWTERYTNEQPQQDMQIGIDLAEAVVEFARETRAAARIETAPDWPQYKVVAKFDLADPDCFAKLAAKLDQYDVHWVD